LDTNPDAMVLGIAVVVSAGAAFVFGLLPALQTTRPNVASVIKGDSGIASPVARRGRMLNGVVVSMVALSFVTLLLSALFTKSLDNVRETHPGFATDQRLLASFDPGLAGSSGREALSFFTELEERVENLPGARAASFVSNLPLGDRTHNSRVYAEDRTYEPEQLGPVAWRSSVMPGYFATIGTRVIRGREFTDGDHADVPRRVIINETLAQRFWPDEDAVGRRLRYSRVPDGLTLEVVGVVEDGPYTNAGEAPQAAMFSPLAQVTFRHATLVVHGAIDPVTLVSSIRDEARSINPAVPMFDIKTMDEHLTGALWLFRMGAGLGSALGFLALALAIAGLYGVMSFAVGQRVRELGIRIALGANSRRVVMLVLRRGVVLAGTGIAIGAIMSLGLTGLLNSLLFDVEVSDPVIFGGVVLGLGLVAFVASFVPAWGATKANPVESLRTE
jgi:predicted permease